MTSYLLPAVWSGTYAVPRHLILCLPCHPFSSGMLCGIWPELQVDSVSARGPLPGHQLTVSAQALNMPGSDLDG